MEFIELGFTEQQIDTEFSQEMINRFFVYRSEKAKNIERMNKRKGRGSGPIGTKRGNKVSTGYKTAF